MLQNEPVKLIWGIFKTTILKNVTLIRLLSTINKVKCSHRLKRVLDVP